jgi:mevalonate kinase
MNHSLSFHANGKILLTGEYLVLKGAEALAVPLVVGQGMIIEPAGQSNVLSWSASDTEGTWFEGEFGLPDLELVSASNDNIANRLRGILLAAGSLNPAFLRGAGGLKVVTRLEFNRNWGFGSSSTLTSLIAQWACIDPMILHRLISKGSGYDVACSMAGNPVIFSLKDGKPQITDVDFNPPFDHLMQLIYLDSKQDSDLEVEAFRKMAEADLSGEISRISEISLLLPTVKDPETFIALLLEHEEIIGKVLCKETVKNSLFPDFDGVVKSLGAWGGDFVLALSTRGSEYATEYFRKKSHGVVIPYSSLVRLPFEKEMITI